jgi:hypothetical protein
MTSKVRSNVSPKLLPHLFFAGRAVLTFLNRASGTHMTVKVKQLKDREDRTKKLPIFYVYVSLLDDGETGKRFAATYFQTTMTYKLGRDIRPTDTLAKVMVYLDRFLKNPNLLTEKGVSLLHEGMCCRCGRPLTHPESIEIGFGPECWSIILSQTPALQQDDFFQKISIK